MNLAGGQWLAGNTFTIADIALLAYTRVAHEGALILKTVNMSGNGYKIVNDFYHFSRLSVTRMFTSPGIGTGV